MTSPPRPVRYSAALLFVFSTGVLAEVLHSVGVSGWKSVLASIALGGIVLGASAA